MTIHLSARLAWHDSGWNGHICSDPLANVSCVVHDHIRDSRDDEEELRYAGQALADIDYRPPCARDPGAFSSDGFEIVHHDPVDWRNLPSTSEDLPPYSIAASPYGHMFAPGGKVWEFDPIKQLRNLKEFFDELSPGRSLVFYYLKDGQPFIESSQRIVAGIGRIKKKGVGPQLNFGGSGDEKGNPFPLWSRAITQNYPDEGFRIPLQEYIKSGHDASSILCLVPQSLTDRFSYVSEHVPDDAAVTIIERLIESIRNVIAEGIVAGAWKQHLNWLEQVLAEVWHDRGAYPGIGPVLLYLGCNSAMTFHKNILTSVADSGKDPWEFVEAILDGRERPVFPPHTRHLIEASSRWKTEPESRKQLLRVLARFSLSISQVERVMHPTMRSDAGIVFDENDIIDNPYLLCEFDLGGKDSAPIDFNTIDHGMLPPQDLPGYSINPIRHDDDRRVRALLSSILKARAAEGDTILPLDEASRLAEREIMHDRRCIPDPIRIEAVKQFFEETLCFTDVDKGQLVALGTLADDESIARDRLKKMVKKTHSEANIDWKTIIDRVLIGAQEMSSEDEQNARNEKIDALRRAFISRLCVITGRAGTGKTTVARALIEGIESVDGKTSFLLLAPTGKARIRLQETTGRDAKTIHQFLSDNKWLDFERDYALKRAGGKQEGAAVVLIDEASMIPSDLLAALVRAIEWNDVRRLVLMGDPNQLPPIGPGRPFADIIAWLSSSDKRSQRLVHLQYRGRFQDANSLGLQLSDGYATGDAMPGDDEILARVARQDVQNSDLEVHYWNDPSELDEILHSRVSELALNGASKGDRKALDASFELENGKIIPESWQILSPIRRQQFGTDEINRQIQLEFRRSMIERSKNRDRVSQNHQLPKPAGDHQIIWKDKVIQIKNQYRRSWVEGTEKDERRYVANGEVGIVTWAHRRKSGTEELVVKFGTQPSIRFKYYPNEVDEWLELAYAITVHKSQGSDFDTVFLIIPEKAPTLSRELVYTALTRFKKKLVLLLQRDIRALEQFRKPQASETLLRNTNLFSLAIRPDSIGFPHPENLIHRTSKGVLVRSKSEVIVADTLTRLGLSYSYEEPLFARDDIKDFRLPDFTVKYEGETWYWEHLGMLSVPSYASAWQRKKNWYEANGYLDQIITSEDGLDGSINVPEIEQKIKDTITI